MVYLGFHTGGKFFLATSAHTKGRQTMFSYFLAKADFLAKGGIAQSPPPQILNWPTVPASGVATIFGPPCKQLVWAPGQMVTATTSSWRAPGGPLQPRWPPRGRGACGALATPLVPA